MDAHEAFLAERNEVIRRQRVEREEAAERAADEARRAERQASTEAAMHARQLTGEPVPGVGDVLARARALADADDGWDASASYGSSTRPAMFVTAADGSPVEVTARPRAGVARSASEVAEDELLARARASSEDSWMRVQVARFHARRPWPVQVERAGVQQRARELGYDPTGERDERIRQAWELGYEDGRHAREISR